MSTSLGYVKQPRRQVDDVYLAELRSKLSTGKHSSIYRRGKAPSEKPEDDDRDEQDDDRDDARLTDRLSSASASSSTPSSSSSSSARRPIAAAVILTKSSAASSTSPVASTRKVAPAVIVTSSSSSAVPTLIDATSLDVPPSPPASDDDDEDEIAQRRARARARFQTSAQAEPVKVQDESEKKDDDEGDEADAEEEEEEDEEDEEDESSEDEVANRLKLMRPIFRKKEDRDSFVDRDRIEEEEKQIQETQASRVVERKVESRAIVIAEIQKEEEMRAKGGKEDNTDMPDDSDVSDEETALYDWKLRELARLRRDRAEREAYDDTAIEVEKRRLMTDEEILRDNEKKGIKTKEKAKGEMRFLQRYYHRGAFYSDAQEQNEVFQRDFQAPTGADKTVDKSLLPEVMQVKKFGMRGRTKYTHLLDQDTTRSKQDGGKKDVSAWREAERLLGPGTKRLAGTGSVDPNKRHKT